MSRWAGRPLTQPTLRGSLFPKGFWETDSFGFSVWGKSKIKHQTEAHGPERIPPLYDNVLSFTCGNTVSSSRTMFASFQSLTLEGNVKRKGERAFRDG